MALAASLIDPMNKSHDTPRHVAIVMDGNGRWASKRSLARAMGHKRGAEAVRGAIEGAVDAGVEYLTLYAFSSENWNRPAEEVSDLMGLLKLYLTREIKSLHKEGVRLRIIGNRDRLSAEIKKSITKAEELTKNNGRLTLVIALSYGSRDEILQAAKAVAIKATAGDLDIDQLTEEQFERELFTHGIPDPDLIIRTSGEQRLSNFLLWQVAYSEFLFVDTLWPDFTKEHFASAVKVFAMRERRYGVRP